MLAFKDAVRQRALIVQGMSPDQALAKINEEAQSLAWEQEQIRQNSWTREQQIKWEQEQQQEARQLVWEQEQQVKWEQEQHAIWIYNQAQAQADKIIKDPTIYAKRIIDESQVTADRIYRKNQVDINALHNAKIASQRVLDEILMEYMSVKNQIEIMKQQMKNTNRVVLNPEEED
jgi:hypothetical protein